MVQVGYNWLYENNLSNRNCNFWSASESLQNMPFLLLFPKYTYDLWFWPHSGLPLPFHCPNFCSCSHPIIISISATNVSSKPLSFYPALLIFLSCSYPFIPLSPNPTLFLVSFYKRTLCPQTPKNQGINLELHVLLCPNEKREGAKGQCGRCWVKDLPQCLY